MRTLPLAVLVVLSLAMPAAAAHAGEAPRPEPRMSFLDNGTIRIGADLALGGAITFLAHRERPANLINSCDLGRQIQMSHYSGPVPFQPLGSRMKAEWAGIGWNPIQTGDVHGHPSRVLDHRNDGRELHVRCVPMHWPLEGVPGECVYESWTTLEGASATMRFRATNARPDRSAYPARNQELPAVYVVSALHRFMAYTGERPYTDGALTHVTNDFRKPWPWTEQLCSEGWAALVGDDDWGIGVACGDVSIFHGGLFGAAGSHDVKDGATAYLAPVRLETFDHDIVYDYTTVLILGSLGEIRARLADASPARVLPRWSFGAGRDHWHVEGGADAGLPQDGAWRIPCPAGQPRAVGPVRCWRAEAAVAVTIDATWNGPAGPARLRWRTHAGGRIFTEACSVPFDLPAAGGPVRVPLAGVAGWQGLITGLRIDPPEGRAQGAELVLRAVAVEGR